MGYVLSKSLIEVWPPHTCILYVYIPIYLYVFTIQVSYSDPVPLLQVPRRAALYLSPGTSLLEALDLFRHSHTHLAFVTATPAAAETAALGLGLGLGQTPVQGAQGGGDGTALPGILGIITLQDVIQRILQQPGTASAPWSGTGCPVDEVQHGNRGKYIRVHTATARSPAVGVGVRGGETGSGTNTPGVSRKRYLAPPTHTGGGPPVTPLSPAGAVALTPRTTHYPAMAPQGTVGGSSDPQSRSQGAVGERTPLLSVSGDAHNSSHSHSSSNNSSSNSNNGYVNSSNSNNGYVNSSSGNGRSTQAHYGE